MQPKPSPATSATASPAPAAATPMSSTPAPVAASPAATPAATLSAPSTPAPEAATNSASPGGAEPPATLQFLLAVLEGTRVIAHTTLGRYVGVLDSAKPQTNGGGLSITLLTAYRLPETGTASPEGPVAKHEIAAKDLQQISADDVHLALPAAEPGAATPTSNTTRTKFQTDTQISAREAPGSERTLQRWDAGDWADDDTLSLPTRGTDNLTFDRTTKSGWDQFATNEAKFGIKSDYNEDIYTTKLDRSGPDFDKRAKEAQRLADEIINETTDDQHRAEERGLVDQDDGNEEDKYGAVVRDDKKDLPPQPKLKEGSYVHPGLRKQQQAQQQAAPAPAPAPTPDAAPADKAKTLAAVNQAVLTRSQSEKKAKDQKEKEEASRAAAAPQSVAEAAKRNVPLAEYKTSLAKFVETEQNRISKIERSKKDEVISSMREWSSKLTLNSPVPEDISVWAAHKKDGSKASPAAKNAPAESQPVEAKETKPTETKEAKPEVKAANKAAEPARPAAPAATPTKKFNVSKLTTSSIPSFNPAKAAAAKAAQAAPAGGATGQAAKGATPKLSAKAAEFKPLNSAAPVFTPGKQFSNGGATPKPSAPSTTGAQTPAAPQVSTPSKPLNPFFGHKVPSTSAEQDPRSTTTFSYLANTERVAPNQVDPHWPYHGRSFRQIFNPPTTGPVHNLVPSSPAPAPLVPGMQAPTLPGAPIPMVPGMPPAPGKPGVSPSLSFGTPMMTFASPPASQPTSGTSSRPGTAPRGSKSPGATPSLSAPGNGPAPGQAPPAPGPGAGGPTGPSPQGVQAGQPAQPGQPGQPGQPMPMPMQFVVPGQPMVPGVSPGASPAPAQAHAQQQGPPGQPYMYAVPQGMYGWPPQQQGVYQFPPGGAPSGAMAPMHLPAPPGFMGMPPPGFAPPPGFHPQFGPVPMMPGPFPPGSPMPGQHLNNHHPHQRHHPHYKQYRHPRNSHASPASSPAQPTGATKSAEEKPAKKE